MIGVLIAGIGLVWLLAPSIPWLGRLPCDIRIESEKTRIYIPITTCILLSLLLTGIMWLAPTGPVPRPIELTEKPHVRMYDD